MASAAMIDHLAGNVTTLCEIWKIAALDGDIAAYASHQWNLTFDSVLYVSAPVEPSRTMRKMGLESDSAELAGVFDEQITEADLMAGKWKKARITKEIVNYLDLTMGSVCKQVGFAGKFSKSGERFTVEFQSLASLLGQQIGDLTSPLDRRSRLDLLGISIAAYTHARAVASVVDRRNFTVNGVAQADAYFKNGLATFTSGLNTGIEREIKTNVGNAIELQLPFPYTVAASDAVTLIRGYAQTRADATALGVMVSSESEPDVPGLAQLITYPE